VGRAISPEPPLCGRLGGAIPLMTDGLPGTIHCLGPDLDGFVLDIDVGPFKPCFLGRLAAKFSEEATYGRRTR